MEFEDELQHIQYGINGNAVLLGSVYKEESESYEWNFVACRKCQYKHIVEKHYSSVADELSEKAFPLF